MSQESDSNLEKTSIEFEMIYGGGSALDCRGPVIDDNDEPLDDDPIGEFLAKCADELSKKNAVPNLDYEPSLLQIIGDEDIDEPSSLSKSVGSADPSRDEEIGATPRIALSQDFLKRSDARFERLAARIREFFGEHEVEAQEAIALAEEMRNTVREDFIAV